MKQFPSKLSLKKNVVAQLSKDEMQMVMGGEVITVHLSCGTMCVTNSQPCQQTFPAHNPPTTPVSESYCVSFPNDPENLTCMPHQDSCGSDANPTCPGGGC